MSHTTKLHTRCGKYDIYSYYDARWGGTKFTLHDTERRMNLSSEFLSEDAAVAHAHKLSAKDSA